MRTSSRFMKERGCGPDHLLAARRASWPITSAISSVSSTWAAICNELCSIAWAKLFPDNFTGAAMLPQSPGVDPRTCIPELEKCVKDYGFVGINLNPDPSGGH